MTHPPFLPNQGTNTTAPAHAERSVLPLFRHLSSPFPPTPINHKKPTCQLRSPWKWPLRTSSVCLLPFVSLAASLSFRKSGGSVELVLTSPLSFLLALNRPTLQERYCSPESDGEGGSQEGHRRLVQEADAANRTSELDTELGGIVWRAGDRELWTFLSCHCPSFV